MRVNQSAKAQQSRQPPRPGHRLDAPLYDRLLAASCVLVSLWVYLPALGSYFSPDDLIYLERYRGLSPAVPSLWRYVSGRLYFNLVVPAFGINPLPYLLVNWSLHGLNVGLLYIWVRRTGGCRLAATIASFLFGTSRLFFSVVAQVVGVGDLLALTFLLAACLLLTSPIRHRQLLAFPTFLAALLSKETILLLPVALLMLPAIAPSPGRRLLHVGPLLFASFTWILYLAATGARAAIFGGQAYHAALGANVFDNLRLYATWSADLSTTAPDSAGSVSHQPPFLGLSLLVVLAIIAIFRYKRSPLPIAGIVWWVLGLIPVLPLLHQRYLHYLYPSGAGLAIALGTLVPSFLPSPLPAIAPTARPQADVRWPAPMSTRLSAPTLTLWTITAVVLLAYAGNSERLMRERIRHVLPNADIPADHFVRKTELIRRISNRTRESVGDRQARLVVCIPRIEGTTDYFMQLLPTIFDQGRGLRALYPNIDSVVFRERWQPEDRDFELVAGSVDGFISFLGTGPDAHLRFARGLAAGGHGAEARAHVAASLVAYPGNQGLLSSYARLLATSGDSTRAGGARRVVRH